jgi:hypothetical protein
MQTFDYDQVQTKMNQLKVVFDSFNSRLKRMDEAYTEDMAKTIGALYGSRASAAISQWNQFTTSFLVFDKEFKVLYDSVQQVSRNLRLLEEEAVTMTTTTTPTNTNTSPSTTTTNASPSPTPSSTAATPTPVGITATPPSAANNGTRAAAGGPAPYIGSPGGGAANRVAYTK